MFEKAAKMKLRFPTTKGLLSVEDLFDLPLTSTKSSTNLDSMAMTLDKKLKDSGSKSFVFDTTPANTTTRLQFDIVLHVIKVKQEANKKKLESKELADKSQLLMGLIQDKKREDLAGKTKAELEAELAALNK